MLVFVRWIVIYPVDSIIHCFKNWGYKGNCTSSSNAGIYMFDEIVVLIVMMLVQICFICLFVYEHYNMIIDLGDPQLAKLFWAGHLS